MIFSGFCPMRLPVIDGTQIPYTVFFKIFQSLSSPVLKPETLRNDKISPPPQNPCLRVVKALVIVPGLLALSPDSERPLKQFST